MIRTPFQEGFSMPAEWAPHKGCYVTWPCNENTWSGFFKEAKSAYVEVIRAINRFEPVTVLSDSSTVKETGEALGPEIDMIEMPLNDSWIRDNGPIFVTSETDDVAMVQFGFNGWGEKFQPYDDDAKAPEVLAERLGMRRFVAPMILEGGGITVDGNGTLLTTESCLLNSNRNPNLSKEQVEDILKDFLGLKKVLWVKQGIYKSMIDGHIDGVAAFVRPGTIVHAATKNKTDPNYPIMKENRARLETMTDARGKSIEIIDFPIPDRRDIDGNRIAPCYTNFYIANGGVVAPTFGESNDEVALDILRGLFPEYDVIGVRCEFIGAGGGEIHCITQQLPAGKVISD